MKIAFFGHSKIFYNIDNRLLEIIGLLINKGAKDFFVGAYGDFDKVCLLNLLKLKKLHTYINVCVFSNSLVKINKIKEIYKNIETEFFNIPEIFYKKRIFEMNKLIVNNADIIICYVDFEKYNSGAKNIVKYAKKQGKQIINLYKKEDNFLYGLTKDEKERLFLDFIKNKK